MPNPVIGFGKDNFQIGTPNFRVKHSHCKPGCNGGNGTYTNSLKRARFQ